MWLSVSGRQESGPSRPFGIGKLCPGRWLPLVACVAMGVASIMLDACGGAPPISVQIYPADASVHVSQSIAFSDQVQNSANPSVTWEVMGIAGGNAQVGTITSNGVYTAPSQLPSGAGSSYGLTISAFSNADSSHSASAQVQVRPAITVAVIPASAQLHVGQKQNFSATLANADTQGIIWEVNGTPAGGADVGTIDSSGNYVAPAVPPPSGSVTVAAVSQDDQTKSGAALVRINPNITVAVSPVQANLHPGQTQAFVAQVSNAFSPVVQWSVHGVNGGDSVHGTIDAQGVYTAPATVPDDGPLTVTAASTEQPQQSGGASVNLKPPVTIAISPTTAQMHAGQEQTFAVTMSNAFTAAVQWEVAGIAGGNRAQGTIVGDTVPSDSATASATYTAPERAPSAGTVSIAAVAAEEPGQTASATVAINPPIQVTISPASAGVLAGTQARFTATVANAFNPAVDWLVAGDNGGNAGLGTITAQSEATNSGSGAVGVSSATAVYSAPAQVPQHPKVRITAVSQEDSGTSAQAQVTVEDPHPIKTAFVIILENEPWWRIAGSPSAPYINSVLAPIAAIGTGYYAVPNLHPSEPNYIWLEAGSNLGVSDDGPVSENHRSTTQHLVTQLHNAGVSWKVYAEAISGAHCPLEKQFPYLTVFNPSVYFDDVTGNRDPNDAYCIAHERPFSELAGDLADGTTAQYNFLVGTFCHKGHFPCGLADSDQWLSNIMPLIMQSSAYLNGGVVFITWDENDGVGDTSPVGILVLSPLAKSGYRNSIFYTHSSLLRTIEDIFAVRPYLGDAANATSLRDLFTQFPR